MASGTFTGLTPGIHVNLVAAGLISIAPLLLKYSGPLPLACFIVAMSVTHSFLDIIPAVFLGAPDESKALSALPGHRYLLKGQGMMAIKLATIGSFGAVIISAALFPIFLVSVKHGFPILQKYMLYILIAVVILMIVRETRKTWAFIVFCLSGIFGYLCFQLPGLKEPLLPMLSGMFGIATLMISMKDRHRIPFQKNEPRTKIRRKVAIKALAAGQIGGFVTAVLPGLSTSIAAITGMQAVKDLKDHGFMILIGSIGTVNFVLSLATLYTINKARNGTIAAVQQLLTIDKSSLAVLVLSSVVAGGIALILTFGIAKIFAKIITRIDNAKLSAAVICLITSIVIYITGSLGLLVLFVSTAIGIISQTAGISRTHSMGCILMPVIIYYL